MGKQVKKPAKNQYGEVWGNTVLAPLPGQQIGPIRGVPSASPEIYRRNLERARRMNFGYVLFLLGVLLATGFILATYIGLQADMTATFKNVARLEKELNNLQLSNEEHYSRIVNDVDLEHIRRIAIEELGMVYASEGQIVEFVDNRQDYVRQLNELE